MKRISAVLLLVIFIISFSPVAGQSQFNLSPAHPQIGDVLTVKYDTKVIEAAFKNAKEITCEALVLREQLPLLLEIPLKKTNKEWKGEFKLEEPSATLILFHFRSGDNIDDNNGNSWRVIIYGADGKAVRNAHYMLGTIFMREDNNGFKSKRDMDSVKAEINIEREMYPDNFRWTYLWNLQLRANPKDSLMRAGIKSEFESIWAKNQNNEDAAVLLINFFDMLGMKERGDSITQRMIAENPKGKIAKNYRMREMISEKDSLKRVDLAEKYFTDFPDDVNGDKTSLLFTLYVRAKQYDKAAAFLEKQSDVSGNFYNSLSWDLIERGENVEQATAWAKKGVDLLRNPDPKTKPSYLTNREWKKANIYSLGMILDTYAYGLFKLNKFNEAEKNYKEAIKLTDGKQAYINARLVECYNADNKYKLAMKAASQFIHEGNAIDRTIEQYKIAYTKLNGSEKGFDKLLAKDKSIAENKEKEKAPAEMQKLLKELLNKPEVDFSLKDLNEKNVKLSALKGKVVVLDFWATWCGPCKASFPALQKVYTKYKENPNVVILALNTWEKETGSKLENLVKTFVNDNKYTFTVLYDEGYVEKYGVEGIPTKFIIDKKGKIRFKTVGFEGDNETIAKMSTEIDLLLDDDFYKK